MAAQTLGDNYVIGNQTATNVSYTKADGSSATSNGFYYDVKEDLGLENVGDYNGYVMIVKPTASDSKPHFVVVLWDSNYMLVSGDKYFYEYIEEPKTTNLVDTDTGIATRITNLFYDSTNSKNKAVDVSKLTKTTLPTPK